MVVPTLLLKRGGTHRVYLRGWAFELRIGVVMIVAAMTSADVIIEKKRGAIEVSSSRRRKYYHWEQRYRCHFRCLFPRKKDMVIQTGSQLRYDQGRNCVKMALRDVVQELLPGREILIGFLRPQSLGDFCFGVFCRRCYCVC